MLNGLKFCDIQLKFSLLWSCFSSHQSSVSLESKAAAQIYCCKATGVIQTDFSDHSAQSHSVVIGKPIYTLTQLSNTRMFKVKTLKELKWNHPKARLGTSLGMMKWRVYTVLSTQLYNAYFMPTWNNKTKEEI